MDKIILVGGGGFCKSVIDVAEDAGYSILGILDVESEVGKSILGYKVLGTDDDIPYYVDKASFVVTVGQIKSGATRKKIADKIIACGGRLETIVASDAYVSKHADIEDGALIMHKAMVSADVKIGRCTIINTLVNISHDANVGSFCHISTCASINGGCDIGDDTFIGSQSVVNQGVKIGGGIIVASLSVVNKNIQDKGTYVGSPVKLIKPI